MGVVVSTKELTSGWVNKGTVGFGHGFSTQDRSRKVGRAQLVAL